MTTPADDIRYMRRALRIAAYAAGYARPNPMVGAVITARGRIIGQGWTQPWGGPHAEVMAVRSVSAADRPLLREATIYVTLEPCSHYGKTPPCARMLIEEGIPRVVVGADDPFREVSGRGLRMLREAGCEVVSGVLREECEWLNRRFMTAHRLGRPWIELKWAQTADGAIGATTPDGKKHPLAISDPLTAAEMHADRAMADAILIGSGTFLSDHPSLTVRLAPARTNPLRVILDRRGRIAGQPFSDGVPALVINDRAPLPDIMRRLYADHAVTSLIVEGGSDILAAFIAEGLYDEIRIETSPRTFADLAKNHPGATPVEAPRLPAGLLPAETITLRDSEILRLTPRRL